ncbi:hypothetical protein ISS04_00670 [Candidatus Woesearchaeota archaeon]|nr:hypothetical protein [Candidatus Woesearchaeota archaeon]
MEKFQEYLVKSKKNLRIADHMVFVTYTLIKDPKLLLSALRNIFLSLTNGMNALLYHERLFKRIPIFPENFSSKFSILKNNCMGKHNLNQSYIFLIRDLHNLLLEHKNSPVEFARKDKFIICSSNYRMKSIALSEIKEYISRTKSFIQDIEKITSKNERIFT